MKKKSAAFVVVALGVLPFYACSNSEQAAYMERTSIEANALEAEQAEQEFAELAAKESAGEDTHSSHGATEGKKEKSATKKVAKQEAPKTEKRKPAHEPGHTPSRKVASVQQTGSQSSVWVVQLGAFRVKENAEKLTTKLKTNGYPVMMRPMNHSKNGELFVVSLEPTPNKAEAQKWQQELKTKSFDTNLVFRKD